MHALHGVAQGWCDRNYQDESTVLDSSKLAHYYTVAAKQKDLPDLTGLESLERFLNDHAIDVLQEQIVTMLQTTMTLLSLLEGHSTINTFKDWNTRSL